MGTSAHTAASEGDGPFGTRLRRARERAGLSQEELAGRAGLSPNAVGALERGEHRHPYPATLRALAAALGLAEDERVALMTSVPTRAGRAVPAGSPAPVLPTPRTPLVGRDREVAVARALLVDEAVPLLTLTGPGGWARPASRWRSPPGWPTPSPTA